MLTVEQKKEIMTAYAVHPGDTGFGIPEHSFVIREMKDLAPDTFHCGAHQFRLGVEVVVDGAHRYTAGRCHRADAHSGPALLPDQFPAGLKDLFLGCHDCIHAVRSFL